MNKNAETLRRKILLSALSKLDDGGYEQSISLESTLQRLRLIKQDLELKTVAHISGSVLHQVKIDKFSCPNNQFLSGALGLKSKSGKAKSIASEKTNDELIPTKLSDSSNNDSENKQSTIKIVSYREYMQKTKKRYSAPKPRKSSLNLPNEIL